MGDPRKRRKSYEGPKKIWDKKRIKEERKLVDEYGLKNMRELWKMKTLLRRIRREARRIQSKKGANLDERLKNLTKRVGKFLVNGEVTLEKILSLDTRDILDRRLETRIVKQKLANSVLQARQFITHGHVAVNGIKVTAPSYLVAFGEEDKIDWFKKPIVAQKAPPAPAEEKPAESQAA